MAAEQATVTPPLVAPARLAVADAIAREFGAGALLVASGPALRWLGVPRPAGVLVLVSSGAAVVVAPSEADLDVAEPVERYEGDAIAPALLRALGQAGLAWDVRVALEPSAVPLAAAEGLGGRPWADATALLARARVRKDAGELALIGAAAKLVEIGHAALREAARDGAETTELELWSAVRTAVEAAKGRPLHAIVDLMAGARTALVGLPPSGASVAADAPILFDLAPRHDGYWADSCATFARGTPSAAMRRMHDAACAALDVGIAAARPGVRACDLDALVRGRLSEAGYDCPHHMGHGVGAASAEAPRIDRHDVTVLEEGMVVALEPGAYRDGVGVRVEHLLVVEAAGARPLTAHSLSLT